MLVFLEGQVGVVFVFICNNFAAPLLLTPNFCYKTIPSIPSPSLDFADRMIIYTRGHNHVLALTPSNKVLLINITSRIRIRIRTRILLVTLGTVLVQEVMH